MECVREFRPDYLLALNGMMLTPSLLQEVSRWKCKNVLWLWDGLVRFGWETLKALLPDLSCIAVFEYHDLDRLRGYHGKTVYLPLGYDAAIYESIPVQQRDIDISFIGMPSKDRLLVLDEVAAYAAEHGKKLFVGGKWYDERFWKRSMFRRRHSALFPFIENRIFSLRESATIYKRSKIGLNLGVPEHRSMNPRTFEILAAEALQMIPAGQDANGRVRMGKDLLEYRDVSHLIRLIDEYLLNEEKRIYIARNGYVYNQEHNTMQVAIETLLGVLDT